jgi:peptide/nickel transport system permease protein
MSDRTPDFPSPDGDFPRDEDALMHQRGLAAEVGLIEGESAALEVDELRARGATPDEAEGIAKRKLGVGFWIATGIVGLLALLALLAPVLPGLPSPVEQPSCSDPDFLAAAEALDLSCGQGIVLDQGLPPLSARLDGSVAVLGTDGLGRDQLSRVIWGARVSLTVGFATIFLGIVIGGTIGLIAGYFRKGWDSSLMAGMDVLLAFPALLLALAIVAIRGKGLVNSIIALTVVSIPTIARLVRANTLVVSQREFVMAARTLGARHTRVITREILPNASLALLPFIPLGAAIAVAAEGALAYLGQSVELPDPSWGAMISEGRPLLETTWWVPMIPAGFLVLLMLSLNYIGDRLREYFAIKEAVL